MKMSDPVNLADVRFAEATPEQFREFWEGQGWKVDATGADYQARKEARFGVAVYVVLVEGMAIADIYLGYAGESLGRWFEFPEPMPRTFGETLRLANNLAQAELFGGWAE
jgi:hypothetical protein